MKRLILVVNLHSGEILDRDTETLTLELPSDFGASASDLLVDADRLGRYRTAAGATCTYSTRPIHLSRRAAGEECLVATLEVESGGEFCTRRYSRSMVKP